MTTSDLALDGGEASLPHAGWRKKRQGWTAAASNLPPPMRLRITGLTVAIDGCGKTAFRSFGVGLA
jgi:hypothetical protein